MKILITGIHGFVGSNLVQAFGHKHQIFGLDIVAPDKEGVIRTYNWDELSILPEVDMVIHLAGKAHDTRSQVDSEAYFRINTGLTRTIYDWFLKSGASGFIFFSTIKAAADTVDLVILTEDIVPSPKGPYGESKLEAEKYLLNLMQANGKSHHSTIDKRTYILRPSMIHGPGNKGNLNLLYTIISRGLPWPLGAFENKRSFTSIDNLLFILEKLIESDVPQGIYNIADDEPLSTNELIRLISMTLGNQVRILKINKRLIITTAALGTILHFPLNSERLKKLTENYVVANSKIKHVLNIDKLPCSSSEGIVKTIKSFIL